MQICLQEFSLNSLLKKLTIILIAISSVACSFLQNANKSEANGNFMSFNRAFNHVIKSEGGYSNKENDATGEVRYGITGTTARRNGYKGSMRKLPLGTAKRIYKKQYWNRLPKKLAGKAKFVAFDAAINQGPGYTRKLVRDTGGDIKKMIRHRRARYYYSAKKRPKLKKFLKGWMNRLNKVEKITEG